MNARAGFVLILAALGLAGCGGSPGAPSDSSPPAPDLTGNWQIESGGGSIASPAVVSLLGALESSGGQVTGTFRYNNLAVPTLCALDQVVSFSGSIDSENNLKLSSMAMANGDTIKLALAISVGAPDSAIGTVEVDRQVCPFSSASATGKEIANTSGNYTGSLMPGTIGLPTPGVSGTGTLMLTQSSIPGTDGQFPATGTLSYQFGSCAGSVALTGAVSGIGVTLTPPAGIVLSPQTVTLTGFADPDASKISTVLLFAPAPCSTDVTSSATYTGVLTRQ